MSQTHLKQERYEHLCFEIWDIQQARAYVCSILPINIQTVVTQNSPQVVYFPSFPYKSGRLGAYRNRAGIPEADGVLVLFILNFWGSESSQNHSKCIQNESSTIIVAIPLYFHIGPGAWALIGTARDFRNLAEI